MSMHLESTSKISSQESRGMNKKTGSLMKTGVLQGRRYSYQLHSAECSLEKHTHELISPTIKATLSKSSINTEEDPTYEYPNPLQLETPSSDTKHRSSQGIRAKIKKLFTKKRRTDSLSNRRVSRFTLNRKKQPPTTSQAHDYEDLDKLFISPYAEFNSLRKASSAVDVTNSD